MLLLLLRLLRLFLLAAHGLLRQGRDRSNVPADTAAFYALVAVFVDFGEPLPQLQLGRRQLVILLHLVQGLQRQKGLLVELIHMNLRADKRLVSRNVIR